LPVQATFMQPVYTDNVSDKLMALFSYIGGFAGGSVRGGAPLPGQPTEVFNVNNEHRFKNCQKQCLCDTQILYRISEWPCFLTLVAVAGGSVRGGAPLPGQPGDPGAPAGRSDPGRVSGGQPGGYQTRTGRLHHLRQSGMVWRISGFSLRTLTF
jgi:hypothetical protein